MAVFTEEAWNGTGGLSTYFDVFTIFRLLNIIGLNDMSLESLISA